MTRPAKPIDRPSCPLCGGPNGCAPVSSGTFEGRCWCVDVRVSPAARSVLAAAGEGCACVDCLTRLSALPSAATCAA